MILQNNEIESPRSLVNFHAISFSVDYVISFGYWLVIV